MTSNIFDLANPFAIACDAEAAESNENDPNVGLGFGTLLAGYLVAIMR